MSKERRSRQIQVRLSLFSFLGLLLCWALISVFAFYFGTIAGRMAEVRDSLQRAARVERIAPPEEGFSLSFPESLSAGAPGPASWTQKPGREQNSGGGPEGSSSALQSVEEAERTGLLNGGAGDLGVASRPVGKGEEKVLQIGAFRDLQRAERLVRSLRSKGFPAYIVSSDSTSNQGSSHRVQVGPFSDPAEAMRTKQLLENQEALDSVLVLNKPAAGEAPP